MNKSLVKGILIGAAVMVVIAAGADIGYKALTQPKFAEVVGVKEVTETIKTPREECRDVVVQQQAPVKDPYRITGTVIGGVAGGVLGHQIGSGRGKDIATVVGAAGGAYAGNQAQGYLQNRDTVTTTQRECKTVYDTSQKLLGYDVTYRIKDKEGVVRTSFKPGATLPLKDGQVDVTPPTTMK